MSEKRSSKSVVSRLLEHRDVVIAIFSAVAIVVHLILRLSGSGASAYPLYAAIVFGGLPLVADQVRNMLHWKFASDLLAGISIVTAVLLHEYLAAVFVILMLSGGTALEHFAVGKASSVLHALAKRMPQTAHKRTGSGSKDVPVDTLVPGDELLLYPHEICPVDGVVLEGNGTMNEAYLTGEPYEISKGAGSVVISGAINGISALTIRATRPANESRYARIMQVMQETAHAKVPMRRIGDALGAWYTPIAIGIALAAGIGTGEWSRFLAVLVVATPCPLIIAIPIAVIGAISISAKRGIVIRDPAVLETLETCSTIILDKTGTLTLGRPQLIQEKLFGGFERGEVLSLVLSLEEYSRHPLAVAFLDAFHDSGIARLPVTLVQEPPGAGLCGVVNGKNLQITSRRILARQGKEDLIRDIPSVAGLECAVLIEGKLAAWFQFRDTPRPDSHFFIEHLGPAHRIDRVLLVSGDRESEVRYLAEQVGITEIFAGKSPEEKVEIVRKESERAKTVFIGDGINDAPALLAAHAGVALGNAHDVTSEAAGAVILEPSLKKVDELFHISGRMRSIALQSAIGGMALSLGGMFFAAAGLLTPVAGAVTQEIIDLFAVLNALRVARVPKQLSDMRDSG